MNLGRIRRIGIALTAAYSMALHGLLLSFVPLSAAALTDSLSALCAYNDTDGTGHPVPHDIPCFAICVAMGHGIAGAVPPAVAEIFAQGTLCRGDHPAGRVGGAEYCADRSAGGARPTGHLSPIIFNHCVARLVRARRA